MTMISLLAEPCKNVHAWERPCPPDGIAYPSPVGPILTFLVVFALLTIGIFLYEALIGRKWQAKLTFPNAELAAHRISAALSKLPALHKPMQIASCKSIAADLLLIVDFTLLELTRYWLDQPTDHDLLDSVHSVRREAIGLRRPLDRARIFLNCKPLAVRGQGLILEATAKYVSVFTPVLKQLHEKHASSQDFIPILEIRLPKTCQS